MIFRVRNLYKIYSKVGYFSIKVSKNQMGLPNFVVNCGYQNYLIYVNKYFETINTAINIPKHLRGSLW